MEKGRGESTSAEVKTQDRGAGKKEEPEYAQGIVLRKRKSEK